MTSLGFSLPLRTQKNVSEKHFLDGGGGVKCLLHTLRHPKRQQTPPSRQNKASDKRLELAALCYIKPGSHIRSWGRPQAENWPGRPIKHPTHPPLYPFTLFLFFFHSAFTAIQITSTCVTLQQAPDVRPTAGLRNDFRFQ